MIGYDVKTGPDFFYLLKKYWFYMLHFAFFIIEDIFEQMANKKGDEGTDVESG